MTGCRMPDVHHNAAQQTKLLAANYEILGIDALAIGEGGAGANMLSPAMYEQLLLPGHQRMIGRIDGPTIMHISPGCAVSPKCPNSNLRAMTDTAAKCAPR